MSLDVDSVCTHEDLGEEVGGVPELENVLPASWGGSSLNARAKALRDVLKALGRRTPPVYDSDIQDPTELRDAVTYGAAERVYRAAMTTPDSVFSAQQKLYDGRFKSEVLGLQVTVSSSTRAHPGLGVPMERR